VNDLPEIAAPFYELAGRFCFGSRQEDLYILISSLAINAGLTLDMMVKAADMFEVRVVNWQRNIGPPQQDSVHTGMGHHFGADKKGAHNT